MRKSLLFSSIFAHFFVHNLSTFLVDKFPLLFLTQLRATSFTPHAHARSVAFLSQHKKRSFWNAFPSFPFPVLRLLTPIFIIFWKHCLFLGFLPFKLHKKKPHKFLLAGHFLRLLSVDHIAKIFDLHRKARIRLLPFSDLVSRMNDRRMVAPTELLSDGSKGKA